MAQIEKTDQIDKYLDQIDKKDSSSKKRIFILLAVLLVAVGCIFAYNQFAGKDTVAHNNTSPSGVNNDAASTVYVNTDDELTDDELIAELEAEEEIAAAALLAEEEEAANAEEAEADEQKNKNRSERNNKPSDNSVTPGVSNKSYTAEELGKLPKAKTFSEAQKERAAAAAAAKKAKEEEEKKAEEEEKEDEGAEEVKEDSTTEEEVAETAPAEPEEVEEVAPEPAAPKGITKDPSYPGGEAKMRQFFARKITYPNQAINNKIEGNVNVRIKVNASGKIVDSQVVKGIGSGCDREVLRAINRMPKWEPAMENGEKVAKHYLLSVAFKLPK